MNIGLDVDGVLTDFEWFLDFHARKMFRRKFMVDIKQYKFVNRFNCSPKAEVKFYAKYLWRYIHKTSIREGAAVVIKALRKQGNKIFIITARALASSNSNPISLMMRKILKKWLKRNGVEYDGIYFCGSNNSAAEKYALTKKLRLNYFIEDNPDNILALKDITSVICLSANYNLDIPNVYYALDFGEVFHIISSTEKMIILPFEKRNMMSSDKREEYFTNLRNYYSSIPSDVKVIKKSQEEYKRVCKRIGFLFRSIIKYELIIDNNAKFIDNALYICNHRRALDIPLTLYALRNQFPRLLVKKEIKGSVGGNILSKIGAVFVNRSSCISGKRAQNILIQTVLSGGSILIFPEGTRNKTKSPLLPFRYGAFYIAQVTGRPIIPMAMRRINKRHFIIKVGEPVYIDKADILESKKIEVQEMVMNLLE